MNNILILTISFVFILLISVMPAYINIFKTLNVQNNHNITERERGCGGEGGERERETK